MKTRERGQSAKAARVLALFVLLGMLGTSSFLYVSADRAVNRVLRERLLGAGLSAVSLLLDASGDRGAVLDDDVRASNPQTNATPAFSDRLSSRLERLRNASDLDAAYIVDSDLKVVADPKGRSGERVNLLRVDAELLMRAFGGHAGEFYIGRGYSIGSSALISAYFPLDETSVDTTGGAPSGVSGRWVLVLEGGERFSRARRALFPAFLGGVGLSILTAVILFAAATRLQQIEEAKAASEAANLRAIALTQMSATAAHEIRNPLGVIRGTVELMRERSKERLTARDLESLEDVLSEVERLRRLTEDFLELSGRRPLHLGPVEPRKVVEEAIRSVEQSVASVAGGSSDPSSLSTSSLRVRADIQDLPVLTADAERLHQVFVNLIRNAVEASSRGSPVEVEGRLDTRAATIVFRVRDHGEGMNDETKRRVFEPYFTSKSAGNGLGLALSRRFVERHGGTLTLVQSEPGVGSTFEVRLPRDHLRDGEKQ